MRLCRAYERSDPLRDLEIANHGLNGMVPERGYKQQAGESSDLAAHNRTKGRQGYFKIAPKRRVKVFLRILW